VGPLLATAWAFDEAGAVNERSSVVKKAEAAGKNSDFREGETVLGFTDLNKMRLISSVKGVIVVFLRKKTAFREIVQKKFQMNLKIRARSRPWEHGVDLLNGGRIRNRF